MPGLLARLIKAVSPVAVPATRQGFLGYVRESFAGAWQSNIVVDAPANIYAQSAVYACIGGISGDIAKLRARVMQWQPSGVWKEVEETRNPTVQAAIAVLARPNQYQNRIKFTQQYIIQKLTQGNAYVLKRRARDGLVDALHVLDACRVRPLIVPTTGDVFYEVKTDNLVPILDSSVNVPASEMIHDPMVCLFHPLVGVSPIYACGMTATLGNKILNNSAQFFANASRPSGILTAPGEIADTTATRLRDYWETNFSGARVGRVAVLGDGLKYEAMTIPANDAQLIEQLKWTVEDVARAFHYPLYKLGGQAPTYNNIESLLQAYYTDCLQELIESYELSMTEGLGLDDTRFRIELDLQPLLRMDSATRYERHNKAIAGGWLKPNEARLQENYEPVEGGDTPYMQSQNQPLARLAAMPEPEPPELPPSAEEEAAAEAEMRAVLEVIRRGLEGNDVRQA